MQRPLLRVGLLYVGGILFADRVSLSPFLLLAVGLALVAAALVCRRGRPALLVTVLFTAGAANLCLQTAILSPHDLRHLVGSKPHLARVRGVLKESPTLRFIEEGDKISWRTLARLEIAALALERQPWQKACGMVAVSTPGALTNLLKGQLVEIDGVLGLPQKALAEGIFDHREYLRQQGIYYQVQAREQDWEILQSPATPPLADRFRDWGRQALARGLPVEDESLRLEWALTLGWKPALTQEVSEPFVRAATYHIFAVDGLRMAIIFGIFFSLLRVLCLPRGWCGVVLLPLIWFYVGLTGWPASAIRATVMLTVVVVGWALKRPGDLLNSLFCAALLILVWQPRQLFQAGFQLSFLVVLSMITILPPLFEAWKNLTAPDPLLPPQLTHRWPPFLHAPAKYMGDMVATSLAAWVGSIPLVAYYFHVITPVSTPANVVAVPLCVLVLGSNLASLLTIGWWPAAGQLFNHAGWFIMECIRVSSHWFADWPAAWFNVPGPSWFTITLYYALLLAVATGWVFRIRPAAAPHPNALAPGRLTNTIAGVVRWWKLELVAVVVFAWSWTLWCELPVTRLTVLPVNGGMAVFCDAPGRQNDLLVDTGSTNAVQFITKPFLQGQGVNRLTALALTHGDLQHVGGAQALSAEFTPHHVYASPARFRSRVYRRVLEDMQQTPGLLRRVSRNDRIGPWTVLHPAPEDRFGRADDGALVLSGLCGGQRVLLLSDLGRSGQQALLERTPGLRADIVVAGLPTVGEALCDGLLDALNPKLVIVADSEFPAPARARPAFRERMSGRKMRVLYTRWTGAVTLEFKGTEWAVLTARERGPEPEQSQAAVPPTEAAPEVEAEF